MPVVVVVVLLEALPLGLPRQRRLRLAQVPPSRLLGQQVRLRQNLDEDLHGLLQLACVVGRNLFL